MITATSKELRKKHLEEALKNKPPRRSLEAVPMSKRAGIMYNARLQRLVKALHDRMKARLKPLLERLEREYVADSWDDDITSAFGDERDFWQSDQVETGFEQLSFEFVNTANQANIQKFAKSMERIGINVLGSSPKIQDYLQASAKHNIRLIKSIPQDYLQQVENMVLTNMRAGNRPSVIIKALQDQYQVTQNRAKLIARDQTAKINSGLNRQRQQDAGFEYFQWIDSDDRRVRSRHRAIANKQTKYGKGIYRWDDLPKDEKGRPIAPGDDYQCRCVARPVLPSEIEAKTK